METFCTEDLTQSENIEIYFKPDFKSIPKRTFTFIPFVNVSQSTGKRYLSNNIVPYMGSIIQRKKSLI